MTYIYLDVFFYRKLQGTPFKYATNKITDQIHED